MPCTIAADLAKHVQFENAMETHRTTTSVMSTSAATAAAVSHARAKRSGKAGRHCMIQLHKPHQYLKPQELHQLRRNHISAAALPTGCLCHSTPCDTAPARHGTMFCCSRAIMRQNSARLANSLGPSLNALTPGPLMQLLEQAQMRQSPHCSACSRY